MNRIELIKGDLTEMDTDAIVNAANEYLAHDGGVAGAIIRKGGSVIQQASDEWVAKNGLVKTGTAAITGAGNLKAKYIIHAVGPVMGSGNEDNKLKSATLSALTIADEYNLQSIAFPAISTGIFGYPAEPCAKVMIHTTISYLQRKSGITRVIFCLYDDPMYKIFNHIYYQLLRSDA